MCAQHLLYRSFTPTDCQSSWHWLCLHVTCQMCLRPSVNDKTTYQLSVAPSEGFNSNFSIMPLFYPKPFTGAVTLGGNMLIASR